MFYGWIVVAGSFIVQLFGIGFFSYSVSLLVVPVQTEFGVNLEQVMYSLTAGMVLSLPLQLLAGNMVDRFNARWLLTGASALVALGLWTLSVTTSVTQYIVVFGLTMGVTNSFTSTPVISATISRWFTLSRGRALAVSAVGTSAGGIIMPILVTFLLTQSGGWRGTVQMLAMIALFLITPLMALTIRGKPSDVGQQPEGVEILATLNTPLSVQDSDQQLTMKDIVRVPAYWQLGITLGLIFMVYSSLLANLSPLAETMALTGSHASTMIMALAAAGFFGKLVFGILADKFNLKIGLWGAAVLLICSFLLFSITPGYPLVLFASILMGLASGGLLPVWGTMMAHIFGLRSYGRAMGLMTPLTALFVMPGYVIVGRLVDASGGYRIVTLTFAVIVAVACINLIPLKIQQAKIARG